MLDLIILNIEGHEVQEYVPKGFWQLNPEDRITYIKHRWPKANWAGNNGLGIWAAFHIIEPS